MRRTVKLAIVSIAIVAIAGISVAAESAGFICVLCSLNWTVWDVSATADHSAKTIKLTWDSDDNIHDTSVFGGFDIEYWADGNSTKSTAHTTSESWTHSNPTVETLYKYKVRVDTQGNTGTWSSEVSAKVLKPPTVTSASFAESTNTITLNADKTITQVDHSKICVSNTIQYATEVGFTYESVTRCGSSSSISDKTVSVVVTGEYSEYGIVTQTSVVIAKESIKASIWNDAQQEFVLSKK